MKLYDLEYNRRQLEERVGNCRYLAGAVFSRLEDGSEQGVRQIQLSSGGGLSVNIHPEKGMDIGAASFGATPLAWHSVNGNVHPAYFNSNGTEWLRSASGGLLMTCGLTNVGSPDYNPDSDRNYPQHGRLHHTPASEISFQEIWSDDQRNCEYILTGVINSTCMFAENISQYRTYKMSLGKNILTLTDTFRNNNFHSERIFLLYHFNFGWPLLTPDTIISPPPGRVRGREENLPLNNVSIWTEPQANFNEQVYYHDNFLASISEKVDNNTGNPLDNTAAVIYNPHFPLAGGAAVIPLQLTLHWDAQELPKMVQWRMPGQGMHVLGLEPANCWVEGRSKEEARHGGRWLEPGESFSTSLELKLDADTI